MRWPAMPWSRPGKDRPDGDRPDGDRPDGDRPDGDRPSRPTSALALPPPPVRRRLWLLALLLVAAVAAADGWIVAMERDATIADYRVALTNLANGMAAQTARSLGTVDTALQDLRTLLTQAGDPAAASSTALGSTGALSLLMRRRQALPWTERLVLLGADGRVANATQAGPDPPPEAFDYFRTHPDTGAFIGTPGQDRAGGPWTSVLARRLDDARGRFAGVVLAELSLAELADFYRVALPPHRDITLLRGDGVVLLRYPGPPAAGGDALPAPDSLRRALADGGGSYMGTTTRDPAPVLAVVRPLRGIKLFAQTTVAAAEVLAGWRRQRVWLIGGGVATALLVAGLVWLFGRQFDAALSNISQGVSFFNSEQRLVLCNRRFGDIYHMPPALLQPGTTLAQMMDWSYAVGSTTILPRDEFLDRRVMLRHDRAPLHSLVTLADGRIIAIQEQPMPDGGFVATHEDITERRQAEERIAYLARHDALTGLPNRSLLMERISQALDNAGRGAGFAVLFLDLDRFKSVNDTLGHAAGDELLRAVTARLLATARRGDTVARLGGDEFVILQLGLTAQDSPAELAERIIIRLSEPYLVGTTDVMVGVSIGIDVAASDRIAAGDLLKNADMALYAAKQAGRGTWRFFEPEMDARLRSRLALERDLQGAVGRDELELYYQPIVHAGTGTVCGFEALLRWHHPQRGLVGPGEFIAVAEECGAIIAIGEWVLRAACRAAAGWPDHIHVSVNLSPVQFRSANLVAVVRDALAAAGLPGRRLELEVTETVLLQSNAGNVSVMHQLRDLGIGMVMDDFGIGYSSLSYLRRFPFERIKIDQSFVREITTSNDAVCVIRAIVGLCRDLGIRTTAEGVETPDQLKILLAEGCSELQGYLFDRPGPLAGLDRFFTARLITEGPAGRAATPKMASAGA